MFRDYTERFRLVLGIVDLARGSERHYRPVVHGVVKSRSRQNQSVHQSDVYTAGNTAVQDRKSTRLNSSHRCISYAVFCLKKKTIATSHTSRLPYSSRPIIP